MSEIIDIKTVVVKKKSLPPLWLTDFNFFDEVSKQLQFYIECSMMYTSYLIFVKSFIVDTVAFTNKITKK